MSFIARQASQANNTLQLLTTTVYTYPTTYPVPQKSETPIPVAAIAGGVIAGMLLAFIITAGWVCWGKSIKRTAMKRRREAEAFHKTRFNTLHNAVTSKPRIQAYQPLFPRPTEKKIRFVGDGDRKQEDEKADDQRPEISLPSLINRGEVATFSAPSVVVPKASISKPKLLRSVNGSQHLSALAAASKNRLSISSLRDSASFGGPGISHKPSTISSASVYSTASGEEHEVWALSDPILGALNLENVGSGVDAAAAHRNSSGGTDGHSPASLQYGYYSAFDQRGPPSNRLSQTSSDSAYRPIVDENGALVGMAY